MTTKTVSERTTIRLLTLERQFCIFCWYTRGNAGTDSYRAAQVISVAERVGRTENAYRQLRRRRLTAHLRRVHPDYIVPAR